MKQGLRFASTAYRMGFQVTCDMGVKGDIKRKTDKVDEGLDRSRA